MKNFLIFLVILFLTSSCRFEPVVVIPTVKMPTWAQSSGMDQFGIWADLIIDGVTQRFRWIEPGTFVMGSAYEERRYFSNEVEHQVTISKGYWLADSECSQAMWKIVMKTNSSRFKQDMNNPVENVSWFDCQKFLEEINVRTSGVAFRLPTEAEWEYACRAGTQTIFSFGDEVTPEKVNYDGTNPYNKNNPFPGKIKALKRDKTVAVKSLPPNNWGLYEMHGNVDEWCADWYGEFLEKTICDPIGPSTGTHRIFRGGRWSNGASNCRSAYRGFVKPDSQYSVLGFRFVISGNP